MIRSFLLLTLAILTVCCTVVRAQGDVSVEVPASAFVSAARDSSTAVTIVRKPPLRWYSIFENIPKAWGRWWNLTMRAEKLDDWLVIGGLSAALVVTDDATYSPSERFYRSSPDARKWSDFFSDFGDGRSQFALAGAFGAYGLICSDEKALRTGTQIVEVVLSSGGLVQVLKHVTGRESPFVRSTPTGVWKIFPNQIDYHRYVPYFDAFPSGHICTSIGTVIVVAENYPDVKWIRPLGYTLTALVGIGMANNGIHWYSDYPLGLFFGYYFGMIAAHPEGLPEEQIGTDGTMSLRVTPLLLPDGGGVSLSVRF